MYNNNGLESYHATTILSVRKDGKSVIAADGQVSLGPTIIKASAKKLRILSGGKILAGFAGATADALTLFERLEEKLEKHTSSLNSSNFIPSFQNCLLSCAKCITTRTSRSKE